MAFEIFTETNTRTKEFISVTEKKTFGLSRAFLNKHGITKNHKAVIFYDSDEKKIALHFTLNNPKFGFAVRISNEKHGAIIIARSFFDIKSIDASLYAGRYSDFEAVALTELGLEKEGTAFVIQLKVNEVKRQETSGQSPAVDDDEPIALSEIPF